MRHWNSGRDLFWLSMRFRRSFPATGSSATWSEGRLPCYCSGHRGRIARWSAMLTRLLAVDDLPSGAATLIIPSLYQHALRIMGHV